MSVEAVLRTHPRPAAVDLSILARCIDECGACEATCTVCVDSCLAEDDVPDLVHCIRLCLDCADTCNATLRILARQTDPDPTTQRATLEACLAACRASADECHRHARHHEHCRLCEEQCRRCIQACEELLAALKG